jgi:hypothetical protein
MLVIAVYNLENKYKNLALEKVRKYYSDKGVEVVDYFPLSNDEYERVYVSSIFRFTPKPSKMDNWIIGGNGYDLTTKLPEEIENIKPKLNFGFTMRGCIRKCHFCIVPEKEGKSIPCGDIYDLWDGKAKDVTLMDNNILSLPEHFKVICSQLRKEKLRVDWNQGLDIRLLNDELSSELKTIRHLEYKFGWDGEVDMSDKLEYLHKQLGQCTIFVIVGFLSYERIIEKLNIIKSIGHNIFVMRHTSVYSEKKYIELARWGNQHHIFKKMTLDEFRVSTKSKRVKRDAYML